MISKKVRITKWVVITSIVLMLFAGVGQALAQSDIPAAEAPALCSSRSTDEETSYEAVLTASKDSYVNSTSADTNYGKSTSLRVGHVIVPVTTNYRSLVAFNLSALPSDAVILSATLQLYQTSGSGFSVKAQALTGSWTETAVTWNNKPAGTTVDERNGGLDADSWFRWDLTPMAIKWYDGSLTNNGVQIIFDMGTNNSRYFNSREATENQPELVVRYQLQKTFLVQGDTYVSQSSPNSNNGNVADVFVGRTVSGNETHTLLNFSTFSAPADSTIVTATLALFATINRAPESLSMLPYAIMGTWTEGGVTWNTKPSSSSQGDPSSTFVDMNWTYFDVKNIVQGWTSEDLVNYGISLRPARSVTGSASFIAIPSSNRAKLTVTYGPPPCYAATSAAISGATEGVTDVQYTYAASVVPLDATTPIVYSWEATDQTPSSGEAPGVDYTWATAGTKLITVTVENCGSSVVDTHQVVIDEPQPACASPLTGLSLDGPTKGVINTAYTYETAVIPSGATEPIGYTWEATGQSKVTGSQTWQEYTWDEPGTKMITVTAKNCGGTVVQYYSVDVQLPADLVISGVWYNLSEERLYYIIKNVGDGSAPAGHTTELYIDDTGVAGNTFDEELTAGRTRTGSIPYNWSCATGTAQMKVCADDNNDVEEDDEDNNCYEETWSCDLAPAQITSGPTVSDITEHGATISWTTNELCKSQLDYGESGPFNKVTVSDNTYKTNHQAVLTGLDNASLYWFKVYITDQAGNLSNSSDLYFETEPPGTDPVALGNYDLTEYPSTWYEFYTLYADVTSDPAGVDRVSFFLDGNFIGRDYSADGSRFKIHLSPAAMGLARTDWFKAHTLQVQAYNLEGEVTAVAKAVTPVTSLATGKAVFVSPGEGQEIIIDGATAPAGASLDTLVYGVEYTWKCTEGGINDPAQVPPGLEGVDCGDVRKNMSLMKIFLDGSLAGTFSPGTGIFNHTFNVNLAGKGVGSHTLRFTAQTAAGNSFMVEREINLVQGRGDLTFQRTVTRNGNVFEVTLALSNGGTGTVYVDYVNDIVSSFQVVETSSQHGRTTGGVEAPDNNYYTITGNDWGNSTVRSIHIDLYADGNATEMALAPGSNFSIQYTLVPFMYPDWFNYFIGGDCQGEPRSTAVYRYGGDLETSSVQFQACGNWVDGVSINDAARQAMAEADYILVTSPSGLRNLTTAVDWRSSQGTQRELNIVLSRMAELAALQNGILGFLPIYTCSATLDSLLEPGGRWADAMHPNFRNNNAKGYVLFVGEQEIIPAQAAGYGVNYSDLRYASISGQAKPELILGRIVGNDLGTLSNALLTSIQFHRSGYGFDRSHAIGMSGRGRGEGTFWNDVKATAGILSNNGFQVTKIHSEDTDPDTWSIFQAFVAADHPDIFFYSGHGNPDSWYAMWSASPPLLDFGSTHPIALGFACSTGNYEDPGGDDYSLPEGWLRYDGAVYIGSSDTSYDYPDSDAIRAFFSRWESGEEDRNVGQVFTYLKRDKWSNDSDWKLWAYEYHLYGDPKFGAINAPGRVAEISARAPQGGTVIDVSIPDYEVALTEEGLDAVEIPDGEMWIEEGEYRIPFWRVTLDYPAGQRVQGVSLTAQAGLVVTTGLNIPTTTMGIRCPTCAQPAGSRQTTGAGGWVLDREQPYDWQVAENSDGTSTLELLVYPFSYNPDTTDVRFFQEWSFDIDVYTTTVDILSLNPGQDVYGLGQVPTATLIIQNSGKEQTVVVQPVIKSLSEEISDTLTLQAVHGMTGTAMLDLELNPLPAGDYILEVTLADMEGHVLDTEAAEFSVGVADGEVASLEAEPGLFKPGDAVSLDMTFKNTGDLALDGMAVIRVETADGITQTALYTHTLTALAPGATADWHDVWDSTGATGDEYRVVGYVKYNLSVSEPMEVSLSTRSRIYLPLIVRGS